MWNTPTKKKLFFVGGENRFKKNKKKNVGGGGGGGNVCRINDRIYKIHILTVKYMIPSYHTHILVIFFSRSNFKIALATGFVHGILRFAEKYSLQGELFWYNRTHDLMILYGLIKTFWRPSPLADTLQISLQI